MNERPLPANADVVARLLGRIEPGPRLGIRLVRRYQSEISDYVHLPEASIENDVLPNAVDLVEHLLDSFHSGERIDAAFEARLRDSAVRRFHQGISIEGLLQAYRLWGHTVWSAIDSVVDKGDPSEVEAAFQVINDILRYVDKASEVVAQAFFAEVAGIYSDRSIIRGPLLDALLGGPSGSPHVERSLAALEENMTGPQVVIVVRGETALGAGSPKLREAVDKVRDHLRPPDDRLTVGVRSNEIIVVYSVGHQHGADTLSEQCDGLAREFPRGVIGVSSRLYGIEGVTRGYGEAAEAAEISDSVERFGQVTYFRDVLLDHLVRTSTYSVALIADTLQPLKRYDELHKTALVATLQAFYDSRYNLTHSADRIHVHPNTVAYRLRRIQEITGLDPASPDDLLLLSLGLKMGFLSSAQERSSGRTRGMEPQSRTQP